MDSSDAEVEYVFVITTHEEPLPDGAARAHFDQLTKDRADESKRYYSEAATSPEGSLRDQLAETRAPLETQDSL